MARAATPWGEPPIRTRARRVAPNQDKELWIDSSLARAMRRAQLAGIVLVQLVLLLAALISELTVPKGFAIAVAASVVLAGFAVWLLRAHALVLILPYYLALAFYYVVAVNPNEPLLGALIPLTSWTVPLALILRKGRWPIVVSGLLVAVFATLIVLAHPGWDRSVLSASLVTNVVVLIVAVILMHSLRRIAGSLDRQKQALAEGEIQAARERASNETTTEYVRVLHDTIVNTFGALARNDPRGTDAIEAQERCRRDLDRIRSFQQSIGADRRCRLSLTDLDHVGLPVTWAGMSGDDLRRFQALLPVPVLDALHGCATEAILNATKHSGADHVVVDVQYTDDMFRIEILDRGIGFEPTNITERGIAESLRARGEAQGIVVALESVIGEGTAVQLAYSMDTTTDLTNATGPVETTRPLRDFTRGMAMTWALLSVAAGIALEVISPRNDAAPAYVLLATILLFTGVVWITGRDDRPVRRWLIVLMLIAVPVVNWCALTSVDYGRDTPYLFQAVSLTVLPVLLHVSSRTFAPFLIAVGLQFASMLIIGMLIIDAGPQRWSGILLLEAPTFALLAVWYIFLRMFGSIGAELADSHRATERALRDAAAHHAATEVQLQWSASALQAPLQLLQDIANGAISPNDPATRERCADEESFLRQISALPQAAPLMSRWFALALAEARRRQIRLELHAEHTEINGSRNADALGHLMLDCIAGSPDKSTLIVTLLKREDRVRMLIVASADSDLAFRAKSHAREQLHIAIETLPDRVLVDACLVVAAAEPPSSHLIEKAGRH